MSNPSDIHPPTAVTRNLFAAGFVLAGFLTAALMWATGAEIATTLRVPGAISPTAPSHNVQHVQGGRIAEVHVALHQNVKAGDVLFDMDTNEAKLRMHTLKTRVRTLQAEIDEVDKRLGAETIDWEPEAITGDPVRDAFVMQDAQLAAQITSQRAASTAARAQLQVLGTQTELQSELLSVVQARADKTASLRARGVAAETVLEELQQRALQLRVSASGVEGRRRVLAAQAAEAEQQIDLLIRTRRQSLADLKLANLRRLTEMAGEIAVLQLRTDGAHVLAPVSGQITDLSIAVPGLVARAGETLAVISQPLEAPGIELKIPARLADQVRLGQEGLLTIDSLPQRTAPRLRVRLTEIASEPVRDEQGNTAYYTGAAKLLDEDVALARKTLGARFQLAVGMPVSVALNGAETTFWNYLTAPFTAMWDGAFED